MSPYLIFREAVISGKRLSCNGLGPSDLLGKPLTRLLAPLAPGTQGKGWEWTGLGKAVVLVCSHPVSLCSASPATYFSNTLLISPHLSFLTAEWAGGAF